MRDDESKAIGRTKWESWRRLEPLADTYLSPIAKIGVYFLLGTTALLVALFGGLWWLDKKASWLQGLLPVLFLWAFAFNDLPKKGRKCLEDRFNMRFVLPLAILSSIGFVAGFL